MIYAKSSIFSMIKYIKSKAHNINYLAHLVKIDSFDNHPNADALKIANVLGYQVVVGINDKPGTFIYFPAMCEINKQLLSFANLYKDKEKNNNPEVKTGFFESNGRVKAIKLRGIVSEGFLLPLNILQNFIQSNFARNDNLEQIDGIEFDALEINGKELWICKKYTITQKHPGSSSSNKRQKRLEHYSKIIPTQFHFHYDTCRVQNEPWCISPSDIIHLSEKIHGTSHISAYVLCKFPSNFRVKICNLLQGKKWSEPVEKYDYIYASRSVIKNKLYNKDASSEFYDCDVWAEADKIIRPHLSKGMTVYSEIVGFTPTGQYIQKNYDYGCIQPIEGEIYTHEKHFKVRVYRITLTNIDGIIHEFSPREVQIWCYQNNLTPVKELYYGYAKDLYDIPIDDDWNSKFWKRLSNDKNFYMELNSPSCVNKVPHEGIVIKKDDMCSRAWKLKTFAFMNFEAKSLDAGELNIEDNN